MFNDKQNHRNGLFYKKDGWLIVIINVEYIFSGRVTIFLLGLRYL